MNKTSTDIEELKKKWLEVRKRNSGLSDEGFEVHEKRKALEVFDFFAPHLSNKSELKKEAVKDVLSSIRQISGFKRDELGQWWKIGAYSQALVTDILLLDSLNIRQEAVDRLEQYLAERKG